MQRTSDAGHPAWGRGGLRWRRVHADRPDFSRPVFLVYPLREVSLLGVFHRGMHMPSKGHPKGPIVPYYATDLLTFKVSLASLWELYNTDGFVVAKSFKVSVRFLTVASSS